VPRPDSIARLNVDLATAKILVWFVRAGRAADLTAESHLYFWDRSKRLAECHRRSGNTARARKLERKAEEHFRLGGGGDGPPYAAAMAMPRPRQWVVVHARSRSHIDGPDRAA
jgi:hypothetical protein